jgi:Family of unknown function (DUF6498)
MSRAGLVALVVANLFVAVQTLLHEWGYYQAILIYWCEVVILGFYNVLRLMVVGVFGAAPLGAWAAQWLDLGSRFSRLIFTAIGVGFFVVKFGTFALAIGVFVVLLPAVSSSDGESGAGAIHHALLAGGPGLLIAAAALWLSHGVSFVRNFLVGREFERLNILALVFWPYARMSLVGGVLLLGIAIARLWPVLGGKTAFAIVVVLLKLGADLVSHSLEHAWLMTEPGPAVLSSATRRA